MEHQILHMLLTPWQVNNLLFAYLRSSFLPFLLTHSNEFWIHQILVSIASIVCIVTFTSYLGFIGIWIALSIYMCLRMVAGFWRYSYQNTQNFFYELLFLSRREQQIPYTNDLLDGVFWIVLHYVK
jgi:uncharacterized membrane protein